MLLDHNELQRVNVFTINHHVNKKTMISEDVCAFQKLVTASRQVFWS